MKSYLKKTLLFLSLMLCFTGCGNQSSLSDLTNTEKDETDSTTAPETRKDALYFVDENNQPLYTVVYPEESIEVIGGAAEMLRAAIADATITIVKREKDSKTISTPREILIGKTSRTDAALVESLGLRDYRILAQGDRIVIVGGSDFATARAAQEFIKLFDADTPYVAKDLSIEGTVTDVYRVAATNSGVATIDIYEIFPFSNEETKLIRSYPVKVGSTGINFRIDRNGREVIVAGSGTHAYVLDYETGDLIWETYAAASGTHGAELLPNGIVATASSSASKVRLFDMDTRPNKYTEIDFPDAHGVQWDPTQEVLWVIGSNKLQAYRVEKNDDGIVATAEPTMGLRIPEASGHDISPVYGDPDMLWFTTSKAVYQFNKKTRQFNRVFSTVMATESVKGIGSYSDGSIVTSFPDKKPTSLYTWTTEKINFYFNLDGTLYPFFYETPGVHHYKCRVFNTSYQ